MFSLTQGILGTAPSDDAADNEKDTATTTDDNTGAGLWGTASAALGSWGEAASGLVTGASSDPDAEEELCQNLEDQIQQAEQAALGAVTSLFGTLSQAAGGATTALTEAAQGAVFELDKLQQEELQKDARKARILESLDRYLDAYPTTEKASYEEWLEYYLANYESAWDAEQGKIDESYYTEESVHRNLWNERIYQDSDGTETPNRAYVKAKDNRKKELDFEQIDFEPAAVDDTTNNDKKTEATGEIKKEEEKGAAAGKDEKAAADEKNETKDNDAKDNTTNPADAAAASDKKDDASEEDCVLVEKAPEAEQAPAPAPVPAPAPKKKPAAAEEDDDDLADLLG